MPHNLCDYLPTCEETKCHARRADRENGVGERPSFPVLCPLFTFSGAIFKCQSFQTGGEGVFSLILEGKI